MENKNAVFHMGHITTPETKSNNFFYKPLLWCHKTRMVTCRCYEANFNNSNNNIKNSSTMSCMCPWLFLFKIHVLKTKISITIYEYKYFQVWVPHAKPVFCFIIFSSEITFVVMYFCDNNLWVTLCSCDNIFWVTLSKSSFSTSIIFFI